MKMKKLAAAIAAALVLAASAVCLTACGGGGTDTGVVQQQAATLAGTRWDITSMTVNGTTMSIEEMEQLYGSDLEMYFSFADSTVTSHLMGETNTTSYTYENGVLTIDGESTTISGDTMTFVVEGQTIELKKSGSASAIGGTETKHETAADSIQSLNGTSWKITSMTQDGEEVSDEINGAGVTFTADQMILSYGGETEYVDYTLENGVIDAEGIRGIISGDKITFSQGNQIMIMEKTSGISVDVPSDNSTMNSLVGTNWEMIKMVEDGEDVSDQIPEIGGVSVTFTADQMILTANGLGESEYVDYTYENGVIDAEGIVGRVSGDTITFAEGTEEMVLRRK